MIQRLGYDIEFQIPAPVSVVALLNVHPSRVPDLRTPDELRIDPAVAVEHYLDSFGNRCARFMAAPGTLRLTNEFLIWDSGEPDPVNPEALEIPVQELPHELLRYLLNSRYCEVDRFTSIAWDLFGALPKGWSRVQAVCDWVHSRVRFGYEYASPTKSALDVYTERVGVCRDFQHLAITLCRALNIPARYATGYLGDIRIAPAPFPMDFSAWFEVYLDGRWFVFDARHNMPRIGRIGVSHGRDAMDVPLVTSFGRHELQGFKVWTDEVAPAVVENAPRLRA
jgi:transglutaminase-like putative cysteine protease